MLYSGSDTVPIDPSKDEIVTEQDFKMEDIKEVHILLMGNLFLKVKEKISEFDLKGSIINREVHMPYTMKDCLKDLNL